MLQIIKKEDKQKYADIAVSLGISIDTVHVSEAMDGDDVIGFSLYTLEADRIRIHIIQPCNDLVLYDGIVRSVLFLAVMKGIEKACFDEQSIETARRLKLIDDNSCELEPISQIFNGCADCRHKK